MIPIDLSVLSHIAVPILVVTGCEFLLRREGALDLFKTLLVLLVPISVVPLMHFLGYF
jgi:hypothetical protein